MSVSLSRFLLSWAMIVVVPISLLGQNPGAILHSQGGVWVNGYEAKDATAIFSGDLLETKPGFSAKLDLEGSSVLIQPESVAKFQGDSLTLDHGSVAVTTSRNFKVLVKCITVVPVTSEWTNYEVTDVNGTVQVSARKSDVNVDRGNAHHKPSPERADTQKASVREGEQRNYNESEVCGPALKPTGAGTSLDPKWIAVGAGGAAALIWIFVHGGGSSNPVSTSQP